MSLFSVFEDKAVRLINKAGVAVNGTRPWDITIHDQSMFRDVFLKGSLGLGDSYISEYHQLKLVAS